MLMSLCCPQEGNHLDHFKIFVYSFVLHKISDNIDLTLARLEETAFLNDNNLPAVNYSSNQGKGSRCFLLTSVIYFTRSCK